MPHRRKPRRRCANESARDVGELRYEWMTGEGRRRWFVVAVSARWRVWRPAASSRRQEIHVSKTKRHARDFFFSFFHFFIFFFFLLPPSPLAPEHVHTRVNRQQHLGGGPRGGGEVRICLLYTSPSPRDATLSRMPSSA